jgi:rSAM/selenodomain-associated transferase 1
MNFLGIFAKAPVSGSVKTRLADSIGPDAACELYRAFLNDLAGRCRRLGERRWVGYAPATEEACSLLKERFGEGYDFWPQPAVDLGGRIEAFFAAATAAGATQTVLIGTDSPDLPADLISAAWEQLASVDVVFGPALDGGYYLIGARRLPTGVLAGVRWSTEAALADSLGCVEAVGLTTALLTPWGDVDTAADLHALRGRYAAQRHQTPQAPWTATERWLRAHPTLPSPTENTELT